MFLHNIVARTFVNSLLFIKGEFLYKVRTKLHIKIAQHDDANFNVFIQRKHRKKKSSFLKQTVENADLYKAVLNITMTTQEQRLKYDISLVEMMRTMKKDMS